jgi:hypothetical protein
VPHLHRAAVTVVLQDIPCEMKIAAQGYAMLNRFALKTAHLSNGIKS